MAKQYPHKKLPSLDLLPLSAKRSASKKPIPVIIQPKKYFSSRSSSFREHSTTTSGKATEQSTASFGLSACREKVNQGFRAKPCPVSSPNNTAFCHSITPQAGNTVQPKINICLKDTL